MSVPPVSLQKPDPRDSNQVLDRVLESGLVSTPWDPAAGLPIGMRHQLAWLSQWTRVPPHPVAVAVFLSLALASRFQSHSLLPPQAVLRPPTTFIFVGRYHSPGPAAVPSLAAAGCAFRRSSILSRAYSPFQHSLCYSRRSLPPIYQKPCPLVCGLCFWLWAYLGVLKLGEYLARPSPLLSALCIKNINVKP